MLAPHCVVLRCIAIFSRTLKIKVLENISFETTWLEKKSIVFHLISNVWKNLDANISDWVIKVITHFEFINFGNSVSYEINLDRSFFRKLGNESLLWSVLDSTFFLRFPHIYFSDIHMWSVNKVSTFKSMTMSSTGNKGILIYIYLIILPRFFLSVFIIKWQT
jgi:hypothetical protein